MTKFSYFFLATVLTVMIAACTETSKPNEPATEVAGCKPIPPDTAFDAIDTATANSWIRAYRKSNPNGVKYFTSAATDFWEALGLHKRPAPCSHYPKIRLILAMDTAKTIHVLFTPADSLGRIIWLHGKHTRGSRGHQLTSAAVVTGAYVMDFTQPCPTTCVEN